MTERPLQDTAIDPAAVAQALRRRWWVVVVALALSLGIAGILTASATKQYAATAALLFRDPGFDQRLFGTTFTPDNADPDREAATNVRLVSLNAVAQRAAAQLGGLTGQEVADKVKIAAEGQSDVVSVTATDPNPDFARRVANTFAAQYITFRRDADRQKIAGAQRLVEARLGALTEAQRSGAEGSALRKSGDQLELLASLQQGNAELVQPAETPSDPASPRPKRNLALAGVLGLLVGLGLAFLLDRLDRRIRTPGELEDLLELPVLGAIPRMPDLGPPTAGAATGGGPPKILYGQAEGEAFRMLRARMRYFNVDRSIRSLLVTSPSAGDGKTTVALNLASAAATSGERAIIIEVDLRRPTLNLKTGLPQLAGLAEFLSHEADLETARRTVEIGDTGATLDVITAGFAAPNPADLIESQRMNDLIASMRAEYDLVVIDTPPLLVVPDAIPLVSRVDGVIVTCRVGVTQRDRAQHIVSQLRELDAPLLGVVANAVNLKGAGYYGYEYATTREGSEKSPAVTGS